MDFDPRWSDDPRERDDYGRERCASGGNCGGGESRNCFSTDRSYSEHYRDGPK